MSYPQELRDHLGRTVTTVCRCWRLTRRDGVALGYTDHDMPLTIDGTLCEPQSGFSASEAKRSLGLQVDSVDVEGALSSASISDADISAGLLDGASVETFLVNWRDTAHFTRIGFSVVGKITRRDGSFVAELESRMRSLDQPNGRYVLRRCDAELGDARCKFALGSAHTGTGAVAGLQNKTTISASGLSGFSTGWFTDGLLTWTSGQWNGEQVRVRRHVKADATVTLNLMAGAAVPGVGDTFTIVAGCDKSFASCRTRFSNALNFRGFPHLPGNDLAYSYATDSGNFDGGAVVR
ncbi:MULTISPECIES: DUF2163 domain-containing protein [Mesorhizobium]|uniref:DUF2163 domain-containing protein n=1 Tax=Mesorhizobium denitrificans TaxID=2294114 RepID=A0A371XHS5_9HYPH|nr:MULTISPECIES: DUF2163 domain-containing protein [Mesorhizobium]RFC68753.1 DUF2163 domain-containing protein [Mesorhizobium denitrificans]